MKYFLIIDVPGSRIRDLLKAASFEALPKEYQTYKKGDYGSYCTIEVTKTEYENIKDGFTMARQRDNI